MTTKLRAASFQDNAITTTKIAADAVTSAKIPANAIGSSELDLTASYAFTGTISGAGAMEKFSSSSATVTGVTQIEITLPTTEDFNHLILHLNGVKSTTASNTYWAGRVRELGESGAVAGSTDYRYLGAYAYSNNSGSGVSPQGDVDGNNFALFTGGFVGDGSDDFEMTTFKFEFYNTNETTRYTRCKYMNTVEKRHNDAYHYETSGSFVVAKTAKMDRFYFLTNSVTAFTSYGYALYKVK